MLYDELNVARVYALSELLDECNKCGITATNVRSYMNGFQVVFNVGQGDAILHDGSYGSAQLMWETYGFPWDDMDVTVHTAHELATLLGELKNRT